MATDQLKPLRPSDRPDGAKVVAFDQYIDTQIGRTRRMIKAVDVATALVLLAAGTIAFLLVVAIAEHWLVPGGFGPIGRFVLFGLLLAGIAHVVYWRLAPHFLKPINPVYAARTIEESSPSLKNSLLNLLLFRRHRAEIPAAVYATIEEQAAQRLTRVPIDSAVDRTHLVRLGYVLVAVFTLAALYVLFSPKDPLVAAERVLLPWAEIPPASRVSIRDVRPGTTSVARGEVVDVSAEIHGLADDEEALLRYTTDDQQAVGKAVPMALTADGKRYACRVPDAPSSGGPVGIAADAQYWIEAGDARSRKYAISVVTAPTIVVQRVDYDYPDYTGYVDRRIDGLGDVRGIEGTRATIHARANGPIDEAFIDFEADGRRDIPMKVDGTAAAATITLALRDDRYTPQHTSYAVRFTNTEGRQNRDPAVYPIDVLPDYRPEVELLAPKEKVRDVRLNETVAMEVEARDPDFALRNVRLQGEAAGRSVLDESLLAQKHEGRFTGRYQFTPSEHGLRVGDTVEYWAQASDNRTPVANVVASGKQTLRIISADPNQPQSAKQNREKQNRENQGPGDKGQPQDQQAEGQQGEQGGDQQQPGGEQADKGENRGQQQGDGQTGDKGQGQPNAGQQGGRQGGEGQQQEDNERDGSPSREQPGGAEGMGTPGLEREGEGQQRGQEGQQGGQSGQQKETGANQRGGQPGDAGAEHQPGGSQSQPGTEMKEDRSPVSPDGDNDGEAFDRIRKFLRQHGELDNQNQGDQRRPGQDQAKSDRQRQGESATADGQRGSDAKQGENGKQESPDQSSAKREDHGAGPGAETMPGQPERQQDKGLQNESADQRNDSESPGGQQTSSKGPSGAGDQPAKDQGATDSEPGMKPADKWEQRPSEGSQTDDQEPPAGGRGKRESDSQGEQGGDRAGGGQEGGGQQTPREGTGSAGQNQSADEGAGESSEQGAGHNSADAGQDAKAEKQTGQPGDGERGQGSQRREGEGEQAGGKTGGEDAPARAEGKQESQDSPARSGKEESHDDAVHSKDQADANDQAHSEDKQESGQRGESTENAPGTANGGGGLPGERVIEPGSVGGEAPDADAANLEYTRKQTDLVLEKLAEQLKRKQVDKELLDRLGWTEDELRQFVERWQRLKTAARDDEAPTEAARRELDDALRSLGLRRGPLQQSQIKDDELRDLREGYRGPVPLEYRERLRAYNEGISRSQQEDD